MVDLERRLEKFAREVRRYILEVACKSKSAHVGSSLSCVDLLVSLYFHELHIDESDWENRDIFVLSKGHAAMALYAVLTVKGLINEPVLWGYFQNNGTLPGHLDRFSVKGIEVSAGSLGHGFNVALGMSYGYMLKGDNRKVFALIGDGECQEGSIWEGALFASRLGIRNFTVFLDHNNLQGYGRPKELCYFEPIVDKWRAFGWEVFRVDGHDFNQIVRTLEEPCQGRPKIIIADTVKGKGVSFMEDEMKWHYFIVTDELRGEAVKRLCRNEKQCY